MNVIFALYDGMNSNSAIHTVNLVRNLERMNVKCLIIVPRDLHNPSLVTNQERIVSSFDLDSIEAFFGDFGAVQIFHGWTPREAVRKAWERVSTKVNPKLVLHLEDNEQVVIERIFDKPLEKQARSYLLGIPDNLSHPRYYNNFIHSTDGCTVVIETLEDLIPKDIPRQVVWPGVDQQMFKIRGESPVLREQSGLKCSDFVLVYSGNVHQANVSEVRHVYNAIKLLRDEGFPAYLMRTGTDYVSPYSLELIEIKEFVIHLGHIAYERIPEVLACGDLLVQPGMPDEFNNYRFPSKLPEYLAMGKPVILPKTNIGLHLKDMEEAIISENVDANAIAEAAKMIFSDGALRDRLGKGARAFAERELNWRDRAVELIEFYRKILAM